MNDDVKPTKSLTEMYSPGSGNELLSRNELLSAKRGSSSKGVATLFAVLIAWCLLIAIGSFQTQASTDYRRPLIVILTMGSFLGIWAVALALRSKRVTKKTDVLKRRD